MRTHPAHAVPPHEEPPAAPDAPVAPGGPSSSPPSPPPSRGRALMWSALEGGGLTILSVVALIVFARLLTPAEVGMAALALGVVQILSLPVEMLFHDALVQRPGAEDRHFDAAFTVSTALGVMMAAVIWVGEPILASVLESDEFLLVLAWMAMSLPAAGLASALIARNRREFRFRSLAARSLVARAVAFVAGIALAVAGAGVWSMVAQHLLQIWLSAAILWWGAADRPRFRRAWAEARDLAVFGGPATGALATEWITHRVIALQVGAVLGAEAAGQMSLATRMVEMLRATVGGALTGPALPLFAWLQGRPRAFRAAWLGATELTCAVTFPIFAGLAACAPALVEAVFGARWRPAAPLVAILAVMAMLHFARLFAMPALTALGRPREVLGIRLAETPATLVIPLLGIVSLPWAVAVYAGRSLLALPLEVMALARAAGIPPRRQARGLWKLAALSGMMAGLVWLLGAALAARPVGQILAAQIALGAVLWPLMLMAARPALFRRIVGIAARMMRGRRRTTGT